MAQCLKILRASKTAQADTRHFLCGQLAFLLLAATDGHAMTLSIVLLPGGRYRIAALHDVLLPWQVIGHGSKRIAWQDAKLAMAVRFNIVHYELMEIQTRHWRGLAQRSGAEGALEVKVALAARVEPAIAAAQADLPEGFPVRMAQGIFNGMRCQCRAWEAGL